MNEVRKSLPIAQIDIDKCYYNPGCALAIYKPEVPELVWNLLKENYGNVKFHSICCRYDPQLPEGSVIIANCAGCDRRFRSLYPGIETISLWEVLDSIDDLRLPDHTGLKVSIQDSCGYRHKPQVHKAIRNLLRKMNIQIEEAEFSGTSSVCCGDNFYGHVPNEFVKKRIQERSNQFPCDNVVVYCIACVRSITSSGKTPHYLIDLILDRKSEPIYDTLDEYHAHARFTEPMTAEELKKLNAKIGQ